MEVKKGIKYIDEILEEVRQERGIGKNEMNEIWRLHKKYLKEKMEDEKTHIIEIPLIGNLYYNIFTERGVFNHRKKREESERSKNIRRLIQEDKDRGVKTRYTYPQNKRGNLMNIFKKIMKRFFNSEKRLTTFDKAISLIEDFSNYRLKKEEQ